MTLAGFAADDSIWADFDNEWNRILSQSNDRRPSAPYLHMREATKLKGPFTYKNGWNLRRVGNLVTDLLMYMQHVDKQRFRQFGCTVDLDAYRRLTAEGFAFNDPIDICNEFCPFSVLAWYWCDFPGLIHTARYFFDIDEPFKAPFVSRWEWESGNVFDITSMREAWSVIKAVDSADMRQKPAMQAADLLAWSTNRKLAGDSDTAFKHCEPIMKAIIPSSWLVLDEANLRSRYEYVKLGAKFHVRPGRCGVY